MKKTILALTTGIITALTSSSAHADVELDKLVMPDGFSIEVYASVPKARQMSLGDDGTVYVGTLEDARGRIFAITDSNNDHKADDVFVIQKGLKSPSGLVYKDGDLYVGAINTIHKFPNIAETMRNNPTSEIVTDKLPDDTHHGWKFIDFGPDGLLYVPIGAPCNICEPNDIYASIHTMDVENPDESLTKIAGGVRNTVGFDWDPKTSELWFTDNGGDGLGDNMPADELNKVSNNGEHFGYPYIHQGDFNDPTF
ncbi:MAG: PQQ-dependent sugar dehydrogenase, partial [Emcibacteraceae bacterium]|nr:PQQ-dependent sugar dehydrogenase [Emcibacteraceae bacterium]